MASLNDVTLIGNLTRDPELKYTKSGQAVASFGLAVNESYTDKGGQKKESVLFVDIEAWGKTGELVAQYLTKGRPACVKGRLKQDTWEDKSTGQKRSKLLVTAERVVFLGSRNDGGGSGAPGDGPRPERDPVTQSGDEEDSIPF